MIRIELVSTSSYVGWLLLLAGTNSFYNLWHQSMKTNNSVYSLLLCKNLTFDYHDYTTELPYGVGHERQPPPSGNQPLRAGNNTPIPRGPEGGVKQRALHSPPMKKTLQEVLQSMELPHPASDSLPVWGGASV